MFLDAGNQVVLQNVKLEYAQLVKPRPNLAGDQVYSVRVTMALDNDDAIDAAKEGIEKAIAKAIENERITEEQRKEVDTPLRTSDLDLKQIGPNNVKIEGEYFINCFSIDKPAIVDDRLELLDCLDESLNGCSAHVAVSFYFSSKGDVLRVICQINHVMKLQDDAPLSRFKMFLSKLKIKL